MDKESHILSHTGLGLSVAVPAVVGFGLSVPNVGISYIVFILFSTLPDIDHHIPFVKHRGFSHTVWPAMILGGSVRYLGYKGAAYVAIHPVLFFYLAVSVTLSYILHCFEDMMTKGGGFAVRPLWPLSSWNGSFGSHRHDSRWFWLFSRLTVVLGIGILIIGLDTMGYVDVVDPVTRHFGF